MTDYSHVKAIAEEALELTKTITSKKNVCILGTRVFIELAREQGVLCKAVPCDISVYNKTAATLVESGITDTSTWPEDAWSVGVYGGAPANALTDLHGGYSWHLIAACVIPGADYEVLVDISSEQFSRPKHGIIVASPLVVPVPVDWKQRALDGNGITFGGPGGEVIWLKPAAVDDESGSIPGQRPGDYRKAVDWIN